MDIRKKEAKLKLAGQIFNKEYKTPRLIIQQWLRDNPFNPEELNAKGNPFKVSNISPRLEYQINSNFRTCRSGNA